MCVPAKMVEVATPGHNGADSKRILTAKSEEKYQLQSARQREDLPFARTEKLVKAIYQNLISKHFNFFQSFQHETIRMKRN